MNNHNKGRILEDYVEYVYRFLLDLESKEDDEPIIISRNVRMEKNGYSNEFDIYYEFSKAGIRHKVAIECKNHSTPIDISHVRNFHDKLRDFNVTGVFVSGSGFQTGAITYARDKDILLLTTQDLPNFFKLLALKLKQVYLPTKFIKGEPFYILMEHKSGHLTGSYHVVDFPFRKNKILLFLSKKLALDYLQGTGKRDLLIRGLKQEVFDFPILFAKRSGISFTIICHKAAIQNEHIAFDIEPQVLKEQYYDLLVDNN
ncbi:restriction endonuclease [Mucilaginibacter rubeus]|uniref:restriction endonuclease n=1 Tax=Mucilaginibacter rubeus TaxID=2027860 RepID=UPI00166E6D6A|nr:restriction endonuclease [Mucilaginibacter rubeus]GGB29325.1 hypothetical protein GCM10011500_52140 [Mucilaginibacter rubeus]